MKITRIRLKKLVATSGTRCFLSVIGRYFDCTNETISSMYLEKIILLLSICAYLTSKNAKNNFTSVPFFLRAQLNFLFKGIFDCSLKNGDFLLLDMTIIAR